jgi:hypothetical protein
VNGGGKYIGKSINEAVPLHLPVTPVTEKKVIDAGGIPVEGTDLVVDRIEFFLTPLTLHYELYFSGRIDYDREKGGIFMFRFYDENEKRISPGLSLVMTTRKQDDTHFVQIGSLLLDRIPQSIILEGKGYNPEKTFGKVTLNVK